jgi:hypothetical protein
VVQVFPLQVNFGAAQQAGQLLGEIERVGAAHVMLQVVGEFSLEIPIGFIPVVGLLQFLRMGISVSETYLPPNWPKCPCLSGNFIVSLHVISLK